VVWPLRGDAVWRRGRSGSQLSGVDKWYNDRAGVFSLGQGSFLVGGFGNDVRVRRIDSGAMEHRGDKGSGARWRKGAGILYL
jgi:hypothetical protein